MASSSLILGPVVFSGLELPEHVPFGGRHMLAIHRLMGGTRVVDAMGEDPRDIRWSARFQDGDAVGRARRLDLMRKSGSAWPLYFGGMAYTVVVQDFRADFERIYQVPYEIECVVVADTNGGIPFIARSLDTLILGDLASAIALIA